MKEATIKYDSLQSQSGMLCIGDTAKYFERIEIIGNRLVLYETDNGITKMGRIGGLYNLDEYNIIF
ncbi:MAG: hypothetical protein IID16_00980 [Candidatus Marinimicrobia bacterium]|nr:hypothetical protein [Candidatus Neomarinimicrobiota bacterium]